MIRDRVTALLRLVPVIGPKEDEFDPFAEETPEAREYDEGDDRVHAQGAQPEAEKG